MTRRRWILVILLGGLVLGLGAAALFVQRLLYTQEGLDLLLRQLARVETVKIEVTGAHGLLAGALSADKVVVEGVNVAQRHRKPTKAMEQGGIISIEMPIHVSNVALIDPDGKPTRVGFRMDADGTKTRISRRTGAELS
mgnify:CR=1 FL=1